MAEYEMPGMDGIRVIKTLKQQGNLTLVIIFTDNGSEQDNDRENFPGKKEIEPRILEIYPP